MTEIVAASDVPDESTSLFRVSDVDADEVREAILVRQDGEVACWLNYCQHMTHVRLDKGDGATVRDGEIVCRNHGAMFEGDSGLCTFGPCEGAYLDGIDVDVAEGMVRLADPGF